MMAMANILLQPPAVGWSCLSRNSWTLSRTSSSSQRLFLSYPGSVQTERLNPQSRKSLWRQFKYAYSGVETNYSTAPIDVVADVRTEKGDVFNTDWDSVLHGATAVISTLGGFGTNEQMEKLNGDANILAVNAASKAGIKKFIFISVHDYNLPEFALSNGYFAGKRRAEEEVLTKYPNSGTILRPGFIYGSRRVNGIDIPLNLIGQPLERILAQVETLTRPLVKLPASDLILASPVSVKDVALAALTALKDDTVFGILNIEQIKEAAAAPVTV